MTDKNKETCPNQILNQQNLTIEHWPHLAEEQTDLVQLVLENSGLNLWVRFEVKSTLEAGFRPQSFWVQSVVQTHAHTNKPECNFGKRRQLLNVWVEEAVGRVVGKVRCDLGDWLQWHFRPVGRCEREAFVCSCVHWTCWNDRSWVHFRDQNFLEEWWFLMCICCMWDVVLCSHFFLFLRVTQNAPRSTVSSLAQLPSRQSIRLSTPTNQSGEGVMWDAKDTCRTRRNTLVRGDVRITRSCCCQIHQIQISRLQIGLTAGWLESTKKSDWAVPTPTPMAGTVKTSRIPLSPWTSRSRISVFPTSAKKEIMWSWEQTSQICDKAWVQTADPVTGKHLPENSFIPGEAVSPSRQRT